MRLKGLISLVILVSLALLLNGCNSHERTTYLMKHPDKLHEALQQCSNNSDQSNTYHCQHIKRIQLVLHDFLSITQKTSQPWLIHHQQNQDYNIEAFRHNAAHIQQQFAKHIMQTQSHLAQLKAQRQKLAKKISQNKQSAKLQHKLDKNQKRIRQTQDKIKIMYALVSLNVPTP